MLNKVVLGVIVCLENKHIIKELQKKYVINIKKLEGYNEYVNSDEFKTKIINNENFNNCVAFAIKYLNNDSFRLLLQRNKICLITFYSKCNEDSNYNFNKFAQDGDIMKSLNSIIVKHYIEDNKLYVCISPIKSNKEKILSNKESIIKYFSREDSSITELEVKFIYNGIVLDDLAECFIDLGYNIK